MKYYAMVEMENDHQVGEPMILARAAEHNPKAWKHFVWTVQAMVDKDEQKAAGQLDMSTGRPLNGDEVA
jgi:hypothetical protein